MSDRFSTRKVRLYRFEHQGRAWHFAQSKRDVVVRAPDDDAATTWLAAPISRSDIRLTAESAKDKLQIRLACLRDPMAPLSALPVTQSLGDLWHPWIPTDPVGVMCLEYDYGSASPPKVQWMGRVAQPSYTDIELTLDCEPGSAKAKSANQGARVQRGCFKPVYSTGIRGCGLLRSDFETIAMLGNANGVVLTSADFVGLPLTLLGGGAEWTDGTGAIHRRMITRHEGNTIRLHFAGPDLATGASITVWPNCEQTFDACAARRADPENHYGGAVYLPVENPMTGVSMSWG